MSSNPSVFLTKNLRPKKITLCVALHAQGHIGPIFVGKNVDGPVYRKILKRGPPSVHGDEKFSKFWFQQDGAEANTADPNLDLVENHFKKRVISNCFLLKKKGGWSWPLYSDYFLWGYVKDRCYANRPITISVLRENITDIFDSLREDPGIFSLVPLLLESIARVPRFGVDIVCKFCPDPPQTLNPELFLLADISPKILPLKPVPLRLPAVASIKNSS